MLLARLALVAALAAAGSFATAAENWVFLGTSTTKDGSKGIYRCKFDDKTGELTAPELAAEMDSPTFLAVHPTGKFLYAVGATPGRDGGPVVAFALDPKTGTLTKLNQHSSGGAGPCHISVHPNGRYVIVANYDGGSTAVFRLDEGRIGTRIAFEQDKGDSVVKGRQDGPHAHCAFFSPNGKMALTADLGIDKVRVFAFDADKGILTGGPDKDVTAPPGSGPRHFAISKNGEFVYFCGELDSSVNVIHFAKAGGTTVQSLSTIPAPMKGNTTAECLLSPNGKFVYVSNRGYNTIAAFKVGMDGKLTALGHITGDIKTPRNFRLDPSGQWMLIASQDGGKVGIWAIDPTTGAGKETGRTVKIDRCVCIQFVPVER
jgi:6-phosphogluconolactonase